jgi:NAD(P)-dependent dehydrogenase (short-subunit alcohol dehydrogenase family)
MNSKGIAATVAGSFAAYALYRQLRPNYRLKNKVVMISGGSRGLGLALAREFSRRGARLAICGRNATALRAAVDSLAGHGEAFGFTCDIRDQEQAQRFVAATHERYGRIDVVVNNAGTISVGPLSAMSLADYRDAMDTHFWGPLYLTLAALGELRQTRGRIVNIASIGGIISVPHLLPYNASKFALVGLSEGLQAELGSAGIRVTTVCPGLMRTGSPQNAWFKGRHKAEYAWFNLSATSPLSSISARKAASAIVEACVQGNPFIVLSFQAKFAALMHHMFPRLTSRLLCAAAALLPGDGGIGEQRASGAQSESALTRSPLTLLGRKAADALNQHQA